MDRSLENINIAKLLIYTLSFLFVCAALILFTLVPNFNEFKLLRIKMNTQLTHNARIKDQLDKLKADMRKLQDNNYYTFKQYNTLFSESDLKQFLQLYLKKVQIKALKVSKEDYLHYEFEVKAVIKDPQELLDLIANAYKNKNLIKIAFPVTLELRKADELDLCFRVKVYSLLH